MNMTLNICGIKYEVRDMPVYDVQIFGGVNQIVVSAIKREQENRYRVYVVCENDVVDKMVCRLDVAVVLLQSIYDERGKIG